MEDSNTNAKAAADTAACADGEQNPTNSPPNGEDGAANQGRRTPFTDLSQVDADHALARTLQEQERAYMMLTMGGGDGIPYGSYASYGHDNEIYDDDDYDDVSEEEYDGSDVEVDDEAEDAFDALARGEGVEDNNLRGELDPSSVSSDEAYARALQDAEEREMAARMFALSGINEMVVGDDEDEDVDEDEDEDEEDHGGNLPDTWEEVDPDELSYEELIALGEVVGTESRGLSADTIASLASVNYKSQDTEEGSSDSCVICRLDYEDDDALTVLSCKHLYHPECINNWLKINKHRSLDRNREELARLHQQSSSLSNSYTMMGNK